MMNTHDKQRIADEFRLCITNTMLRITGEDTHRPFHAALLSEESLFWSRFERSFSTSFGQRAIEQISRIVVEANGATQAENQKQTLVSLSPGQLSAIDTHISNLRTNQLGRSANWDQDLLEVTDRRIAEPSDESRVISDLWWVKNNINHYLSIKTVKPNIDQTAEAKRDLLKLKLHDLSAKVYFGLYYNPYGENRHNYAWTPPMRIFDFMHDEVVLIGRDYWDTLGGVGTYDDILEIAKRVGKETKPMIEALRNG